MKKMLFLILFISVAYLFYGQNEEKLHKYTTLFIEESGKNTKIKIVNNGLFPVTVTIDPAIPLKVLSEINFPYVGTIIGKSEFIFELNGKYSKEQIIKWIYLKTGSIYAVHNDKYEYAYPFSGIVNPSISQNINGGFTHKGEYKYAIDWQMDVGTPIFAARNGIVVDIESSYNKNGLTPDYFSKANYILILHDDNTLAEYIHLKKNGTICKIGEKVQQGELIGYSGNTGYSTGPHLHFCVHQTISGTLRKSILINFKNRTSN